MSGGDGGSSSDELTIKENMDVETVRSPLKRTFAGSWVPVGGTFTGPVRTSIEEPPEKARKLTRLRKGNRREKSIRVHGNEPDYCALYRELEGENRQLVTVLLNHRKLVYYVLALPENPTRQEYRRLRRELLEAARDAEGDPSLGDFSK